MAPTGANNVPSSMLAAVEESAAHKEEHRLAQVKREEERIQAMLASVIPPSVLARAREQVPRRAKGVKGVIGELADVSTIAVLDPESGVDTKERNAAARTGYQRAGLLKERVDVNVALSVFHVRGMAKRARRIVDAVVPALPHKVVDVAVVPAAVVTVAPVAPAGHVTPRE